MVGGEPAPPLPLPRPGPLLVVLSGPSGVGKDAVLKAMRHKGYPAHYVTTLTTRPRRPNEQDGVDYNFTSVTEFSKLMADDDLLEWAQVYGNYYGVPRPQVRAALRSGQDVLLKVDVQGAATVKRLVPQAVLIFLMPPSWHELEKRLVERGTDHPVDIQRRLAAAREELNSLGLFDYVVLNPSQGLDQAVCQIEAIFTAERCRVRPRTVEV